MAAEVSELSVGTFVTSCILACCGFGLALGFLIFNLRYRNVRLVKMTSPNMNSILVAGGVLGYSACVVQGLDYYAPLSPKLANATCRILPWLLCFAFTLGFGAILVKSWRVKRIFQKAPVQRVVIRDNTLCGIIACLLVCDVIILSLWQGLDPRTSRLILSRAYILQPPQMTSNPMISLPGKPSETLFSRGCVSTYSGVWFSVICAYKMGLLLSGAYLSWAVRAVTLPAMNDSTAVLLSTLLTAITGSGVAAIAVWLQKWPDAAHLCLVIGVWFCTTFTLCLSFIPKIKLWWESSDEDGNKISMAPQIIYSPTQPRQQVEDEIYHLVAENRNLKKALSEKELALKSLQTGSSKQALLPPSPEDNRQDSGLDNDFSSSSLQEEDNNGQNKRIAENKKLPNSNLHRSNTIGSPSMPIRRPATPRRMRTFASKLRSLSLRWTPKSRSLENENRPTNIPDDRSSKSSEYMWRLESYLNNSSDRRQCATPSSGGGNNRDGSPPKSHPTTGTLCECRQLNFCEDARSRRSLAESIVESYQLEDASDTYSWISGYLSLRRGSRVPPSGSSAADEDSMSAKCSSCDTSSTLGNDRYYPQYSETEHRRKKRRKRRGRRKSWKREPEPKVFYIQEPRIPEVKESAMAFTRTLAYDATFV